MPEGWADLMEGAWKVGGLVLACLYLWLLTKFESKKTPDDLAKEKSEREKEFQNLWNAHILANVENRESEISTVGGRLFVLRTTYHDDVGNVDAKLQRLLLDQVTQGADIKNLKDQLTSILAAIGQTNTTLQGIGGQVSTIAGIWTEHVRQHGGLTPLVQKEH